MATPITLVSARTAAVASGANTTFDIEDGHAVTLVANGLATTETITITWVLENGATGPAAQDTDLSTLKLTATSWQKQIFGPARVMYDKDATAGAASLTMYR